jgi:hypothetical protein
MMFVEKNTDFTDDTDLNHPHSEIREICVIGGCNSSGAIQRVAHDSRDALRWHARPLLERGCALFGQHADAANGARAGVLGLPNQSRDARLVDQVV